MPTPATQPDRRKFLTVAELPEAIEVAVKQRQPLCIHGGVGIGKTSAVWQTAGKLGCTAQLLLTSNREATDVTGIPFTQRNAEGCLETEWAIASFVSQARKLA